MKYTWIKTGNGKIDNLGKQLEKTVRTMNQNRFNTRYRYTEAMNRFVKFIAKDCDLQKLANIKDNHLAKYVEYLKSEGLSDKYIKNELSGIRFFHNHIQGTKNELTDSRVFNKDVGLGSTPDIRSIDRAWTEKEVEYMKDIANSLNRPEIADMLEAMRSMGLRLEEACTLRHSDLRNVLRTGKLELKNTKGGVPRSVPLTSRAEELFRKKLEDTERGKFIFTPEEYVKNREIHKFLQSVKNFIYNHRKKVVEEIRSTSGHNVESGTRGALTAHGLRHAFAREQYFQKIEEGLSKEEARLIVAKMLGHSRDSITYVYLANLDS